MEKEKHLPATEILACEHCGNRAPFAIVASYSQIGDREVLDNGYSMEMGPVWELVLCPSCNDIMLRTCYWHEGLIDDPDDPPCHVVYP